MKKSTKKKDRTIGMERDISYKELEQRRKFWRKEARKYLKNVIKEKGYKLYQKSEIINNLQFEYEECDEWIEENYDGSIRQSYLETETKKFIVIKRSRHRVWAIVNKETNKCDYYTWSNKREDDVGSLNWLVIICGYIDTNKFDYKYENFIKELYNKIVEPIFVFDEKTQTWEQDYNYHEKKAKQPKKKDRTIVMNKELEKFVFDLENEIELYHFKIKDLKNEKASKETLQNEKENFLIWIKEIERNHNLKEGTYKRYYDFDTKGFYMREKHEKEIQGKRKTGQ
ncbi:MAG: hypothetical protein ACRCUM_03165 [Mycoplasmoidaceae bacterium]